MKVLHNSNLILPENKVRASETSTPRNAGQAISTESANFQEVLKSKLDENTPVQFSKHAHMRLSSRNINLSSEQLKRVENGVLKAKEKGITDSLVLVDDIALVVNVRSKMVITAINNDSESIFTNINGAVIV